MESVGSSGTTVVTFGLSRKVSLTKDQNNIFVYKNVNVVRKGDGSGMVTYC